MTNIDDRKYVDLASNKKIKPDADIIKVITFAGIIIILSIMIISSIVYVITKNEVISNLKNRDLAIISESISYKIDSRIERAKEVSLILAKDPQIMEWIAGNEKNEQQKQYALKKINSIAADFDYTNSFIVSATTNHYWDENGNLIDTVSENDPDDSWFFETITGGELITVQYDYNEERKGVFVFVDALMGDVKHPIAVTGVGLGLDDLADEFAELKYGQGSNLWLIDENGNIYLSDNVEHGGKNINDLIPSTISGDIINHITNNGSKYHTLEYQNNDYKTTDVVIKRLDSTKWFLVVQIPRSESAGFLNNIKLNSLLASFIVIISVTFFFYYVSNRLVNPYKKAMERNQELELKVLERTREIQKKNAKITDSIEYAHRIQRAILPSEEALKEILLDHFLIWQPRDTVGGDFYWLKKFDTGFYIAVGDCSGHGVPGALMSMISISILNQIVNNGTEKPSSIIKKLNQQIKHTLKQTDRRSITDDGLDISLCYFDLKNTLIFSGAGVSLYIKNKEDLRILKGSRKSVGYSRTDLEYPFEDQIVTVTGDDLIYMVTDGYMDQNGGLRDYCFGRKRFLNLINLAYQEPLSKQREIFIQAISEYMAREPQRDDITLMAFKVL